ncbi:MAG: hypothetical protein KFH87_14255, partial [Bacteroidetes bacterium]|nr:hypothetical protein [Bacteroidota bacterium]
LLIAALACLANPLPAQPIDLCTDGPITLTIGSTEQVEISVASGTEIQVTLLSDCTNDPVNPPATNGVYCSGGAGNYLPSYISWETYTANDRRGQLPMLMPQTIDVSADDTFTISLDACPGTSVKIECI